MSDQRDIEYLRALYKNSSRHSQYQIMPDFLAELVDPHALDKKFNRYERERMTYFAEKVDFRGKRVLDVGGNTGYFSFEALSHGAREVVCYEGNKEHVDFMRAASRMFNKNLTVRQEYMLFDRPIEEGQFDIAMVLNVLHHVGFDFGSKDISIDVAKDLIIRNLNYFADQVEHMIFQIGFSWMTNYDHPLFKGGTKAEMIDMVTNGIRGYWEVVGIGIAQERDGLTRYEDINASNIPRMDVLGEFRNRPIFILRSKKQ